MRFLKVLGVIIAIILITAIFVDKKVETSQSTIIAAPLDLTFATVSDFSTWESWSPWKEMDSTLTITLGEKYVGKDGSYSWTAAEVGNGDMTIVESTLNESLKTKVNFGDEGSADGSWSFEKVDGGTKVTWGIHAPFPYPLNLMLLFMNMKEDIDKSFTRGLELLKIEVEKKANEQVKKYDIQEIETEVRYFIGVRETIAMKDITTRYIENLPKTMTAIIDNKIGLAGMPSGVFYDWDEENQVTDVLQGAPIKENAQIEGFTTVEIPVSKALLIEYYGNYENIGDAHIAMDTYIKANNLTHIAPVIEEYVTDPGQEPDPAKWLTKLTYYIK